MNLFGTMVRRCMQCRAFLGTKPCPIEMHATITDGLCDECAGRFVGIGIGTTTVAGICPAMADAQGDLRGVAGDGAFSSGLPSGDASQTEKAATPLRSAARLSSAECRTQSSVTAPGLRPPLDPFTARGRGVRATRAVEQRTTHEGAVGLRSRQFDQFR